MEKITIEVELTMDVALAIPSFMENHPEFPTSTEEPSAITVRMIEATPYPQKQRAIRRHRTRCHKAHAVELIKLSDKPAKYEPERSDIKEFDKTQKLAAVKRVHKHEDALIKKMFLGALISPSEEEPELEMDVTANTDTVDSVVTPRKNVEEKLERIKKLTVEQLFELAAVAKANDSSCKYAGYDIGMACYDIACAVSFDDIANIADTD